MWVQHLLRYGASDLWQSRRGWQIVVEAEASDKPMSEVARLHGVIPKLLNSGVINLRGQRPHSYAAVWRKSFFRHTLDQKFVAIL